MTVQSADLRQINRKLGDWDARLRWQQTLVWLPRGMAAGLAPALALALAARFWPILPGQTVAMIATGLGLAGMLAAISVVWLWPRAAIQKARQFDRLFDLRERLSTAIELASGILPAESDSLRQKQLGQAVDAARAVAASRQLALYAEWRWWGTAAVLLTAVAVAVYLPNPQDEILAQQGEIRQTIAESLVELENMRDKALADTTLTEDQRAAVVETLNEAIATLQQPGITQAEALAALDTAEHDLRNQSAQFAAEQQRALEEASGLLDHTAAQDAAEAMAAGEFGQAADALKNLDLNNLTPEQLQQLADALDSAAEALQESNPELAASMAEAAGDIRSGDLAGAEQALDQAADGLAQAGDATVEQVDQYADQVETQGGLVAGAGTGQAPQLQPGATGSSDQPAQEGSGSGSGRGEGDGAADTGGVTGGELDSGNGPGDGGETDFESIYTPQRIGGDGGEQVDIPGNPGAGAPTGNEGDFADNPDGASTVPYDEVYGDYSDAVNEALDSGYIPLALRDLIKEYFSNLDPVN